MFIYCDLQVFEKDIAKVRTGQTVNFTLTNQKDKHVSGRVTGINKSFDAANKSVVVHAVLNNVAPLNLTAGQYVSGLVETGKQLVSAVPKDAIVKANDKSYIFVFEGIEKELAKRDADDKEVNKKEFVEKHRFKMIEVVTGVEELGYFESKAYDVDNDDFSEVPKSNEFTIHPKLFVYPNESTTITIGNSLTKGKRTGGDIQVINNKLVVKHQ